MVIHNIFCTMSDMSKAKVGPEELATVPSQIGEIHNGTSYTHDAVFGDITDDGPNYRNVCSFQDPFSCTN